MTLEDPEAGKGKRIHGPTYGSLYSLYPFDPVVDPDMR